MSSKGDHKKLNEYVAKIMPNNPIAERDKFSSLSQAESTEPIIIHGKPLDIPKQKILRKRLSL
ncbi:hypothetical protein KUL152_07900 [Tenacibaculum sp. KUL152]|nr:hypothetical protein KUL152_07900 [Tenacibaculum sp. KUL152]